MKRVVGCGIVGLALVALFLGSLAGAVSTYGRLGRAEREVDRAWTEIEILCRERAEIVPRLVASLRERNAADPALLGRLLEARERSFEALPIPEIVTDRERFARFHSGQEARSAAVDAVLGGPPGRAARQPHLSAAGRERPDRGHEFDLGGTGLPGRGAGACVAQGQRAAEYVSVTDEEALNAFHTLCRLEGIIPALESSHALAHAAKMAREMPGDRLLLVNLSGRGDKDINTVAHASGINLE